MLFLIEEMEILSTSVLVLVAMFLGSQGACIFFWWMSEVCSVSNRELNLQLLEVSPRSHQRSDSRLLYYQRISACVALHWCEKALWRFIPLVWAGKLSFLCLCCNHEGSMVTWWIQVVESTHKFALSCLSVVWWFLAIYHQIHHTTGK